MASKSKFLQWIDYRVRVTIQDNRMFLGTFIAFDKHLNLVLSETEEFRRVKPKKAGEPEKEIKRALGMIILRGENIVSITAEAPPNLSNKKAEGIAGPGKAQPINRQGVLTTGLTQTPGPGGLAGMPKGVGQINPQNMMPIQRPGSGIPGTAGTTVPTGGGQGQVRPNMGLPGQSGGMNIPGGLPTGMPGGLPVNPMQMGGQGRPGGIPGMMPIPGTMQGSLPGNLPRPNQAGSQQQGGQK